jgi:soluble cytochrome b562
MTTDLRQLIADLRARREAAETRAQGLDARRGELALPAVTGDDAARDRLAAHDARLAEARQEVVDLDHAAAEAEAQRIEAERREAVARRQQELAEAERLEAEAAKAARRFDEGLARLATEADEVRRLLSHAGRLRQVRSASNLTWLSHMRAPGRVWHELGPRGFLGLNVVFLGAAATYLAIPVFWLAILAGLLTGTPPWGSMLPGWALWPLGVSLALGQGVMVGCATLALARRGSLALLVWVPSLPIYWTLGALAAWKAVLEIALAPYYWDKTRHGISRVFRQQAAKR